MNDLILKAVFSGILFGIYPFLVNRSGLTGNISAAAFTLGALIVISPFALYEFFYGATVSVVWTMLIGASLLSGFGILAFNGMLAKATPQEVGSLFVLMLMVQTATPALYQVIIGGGLTVSRGIGFTAAMLAAYLLTK